MDIFAPLIVAALVAGTLGVLGLAAGAWGVDSRPGVDDDQIGPLNRVSQRAQPTARRSCTR